MRYIILIVIYLASQNVSSQVEIISIEAEDYNTESISLKINIANTTDSLVYFKHRVVLDDKSEGQVDFFYCVCNICYVANYDPCTDDRLLESINPGDTCFSSMSVLRTTNDFNLLELGFDLELYLDVDCEKLVEEEEISINRVTSIENLTNTPVNIFPNPTSGQFFIDANETILESIDLYDLSGRLLYSKKERGREIDISHLDNGIYVLQILKEDNTRQFTRLIKSTN